MIVDGTILKCYYSSYMSVRDNKVTKCEFILRDNSNVEKEYKVVIFYPKLNLGIGDMVHCSISPNTNAEGYIVDKNESKAHIIEIIGHNSVIAKSKTIVTQEYLELEKKVKKLAKLSDDAFKQILEQKRIDSSGLLDDQQILMSYSKELEQQPDLQDKKILQERNLIDLNENEAMQLLDIEKRGNNPNPARIGHIENYILHLRQMNMFEKLNKNFEILIDKLSNR